MCSNRFKIFNIVGARPNMMKVAPIIAVMRRYTALEPVLIHTGQHYDLQMSQVFLKQLGMGEPDYNLQVGSGTHYWQTAEIMKRFGELVEQNRPDMIVVAGDVNSTVACALVAAKQMIPIAHVEAGLRSFDRSMPEEINRIVTDSLAQLLFTTEASANENLAREGVHENNIFFTGNVMIDSLIQTLEAASKSSVLDRLGIRNSRYALLTLHRPSNVDKPETFENTVRALAQIAKDIPLIFPIHPRTASKVQELQVGNMHRCNDFSSVNGPGLWLIPPTSYTDFLSLMKAATLVITDSGGVQEETTYLGIPCLTYRDNTERPVTVTHGTNHVIGTDPQNLINEVEHVLSSRKIQSMRKPDLWDGHAAERIVEVISRYFSAERGLASRA